MTLRTPDTMAGIGYICAGAFCLAVNDVLAKYLNDLLPVMEIVFFRMLLALPLITGVGWCMAGRRALVSQAPALQVARGVAAIAAPIAYISGLAKLPLAAAAAISFAAPLFITLLARPWLGERPISEEHTSELQSRFDLVHRLLLVTQNTSALSLP